MIPTTTYDQVRLEQHNRLAHLELRRHAMAAREARSERVHSEKVRVDFSTARRAAVAVCALITAATILLVL